LGLADAMDKVLSVSEDDVRRTGHSSRALWPLR
jgi:hypothetical protein